MVLHASSNHIDKCNYSSHGATAAHTSESPEDLVMVSFDPPVTHLDEMNRW